MLEAESESNITFNSSTFSNLESSAGSRLRYPTWAICLMAAGYILVFIFGVVGNCSVILVMAKLPRLRTITNLFVCNLAIADFLVLIFCLLPNLISNIFVEWVLGFYFCKTVPYIQGVSVCASVYSLVAISIERLFTIRRPFTPRMTTRKAIFIMVSIWIWSCIVALPFALFFQTGYFDPDSPELIFCVEVWPDSFQSWSEYYFLVGNFLICYVLPLCVILFSYCLICLTVYRRRRLRANATKVVVKVLLVIIFIFFLTWLPLYCISLIMKFSSPDRSDFKNSAIEIIYPIAQLVGHIGSAVNPFVYGFRKKEFVNGLLSIVRKRPTQYYQPEWNPRIELRFLPPSIINRFQGEC